ncbi:hypothetical protein BDW75DRAFT_68963 [Aspergillus navahoensis]
MVFSLAFHWLSRSLVLILPFPTAFDTLSLPLHYYFSSPPDSAGYFILIYRVWNDAVAHFSAFDFLQRLVCHAFVSCLHLPLYSCFLLQFINQL